MNPKILIRFLFYETCSLIIMLYSSSSASMNCLWRLVLMYMKEKAMNKKSSVV